MTGDSTVELDGTQRRLLAFIRSYWGSEGRAPTWQEMTDHMRASSQGSVGYHLKKLEAAGYIWRWRGWRNVRLIESPRSTA